MAGVTQKRLAGLVLAACGAAAAGCSVEVKTPPSERETGRTTITGPAGGKVDIKTTERTDR